MYPAMYSGTVPGAYVLLALLVVTLAVLSLLGVALWWWKRPPRRPALPAAVYLAAVVACTWGSDGDGGGLLSLLGAALMMPWIALSFLATISPGADLGWWFGWAGALANAALIYGAASWAGRRRRAGPGRAAG